MASSSRRRARASRSWWLPKIASPAERNRSGPCGTSAPASSTTLMPAWLGAQSILTLAFAIIRHDVMHIITSVKARAATAHPAVSKLRLRGQPERTVPFPVREKFGTSYSAMMSIGQHSNLIDFPPLIMVWLQVRNCSPNMFAAWIFVLFRRYRRPGSTKPSKSRQPIRTPRFLILRQERF
jgi:hypothetical protein